MCQLQFEKESCQDDGDDNYGLEKTSSCTNKTKSLTSDAIRGHYMADAVERKQEKNCEWGGLHSGKNYSSQRKIESPEHFFSMEVPEFPDVKDPMFFYPDTDSIATLSPSRNMLIRNQNTERSYQKGSKFLVKRRFGYKTVQVIRVSRTS